MEISKTKIQLFRTLGLRKRRRETGLFIVEGEKCVGETLPYFQLEALICAPDYIAPVPIEAERRLTASPLQLTQLSQLSTPSRVVAVYHMPELRLPKPEELRDKLTVVLDGVQDPGNLGTIMRLCAWYGVRQILASPDTADIFNPKSVQATMGAIGRVAICYASLPEYLAACRDIGLPVFGTLLHGENIYHTELSGSALLVMGNEGRGITPAVQKLITEPLYIPPYPPDSAPGIESLNVACATAITLSEFRRNG